jgi:outer membrane protein assembly factor BamB
VNNSTIFVAERDRNYTLPKTLYVLDLTGKIMSKTSVEGYLPEFYIWKDKTIVNTRNSISMYNAKGEIQWKKDLEIHVQTTPRVLSDETVLIRDADNTVHAIDKSGNIIWIFTNPLYLDHELFNIGKDNSLIGALEGNRAYLIGISKSGKKLWETKLPSLHSTPNELHILANGNILFHSFKEIYDVKTSKSSYFQSIGVIDQQGKLLWNKTFAGADLHKKNLQADKYSNIYLSTTLKPNGIFNSNFYVYRPNGDLVYKYQNSPYFITKILDFDKMHAIGEGLQYNKESKMYRSTEKWYKIQLPSFSKK